MIHRHALIWTSAMGVAAGEAAGAASQATCEYSDNPLEPNDDAVREFCYYLYPDVDVEGCRSMVEYGFDTCYGTGYRAAFVVTDPELACACASR
jgi:hypothetical protein